MESNARVESFPNPDFKSPAEKMFSLFSTADGSTGRATPDLEEIAAARGERQMMVSGYNRGARELDSLNH